MHGVQLFPLVTLLCQGAVKHVNTHRQPRNDPSAARAGQSRQLPESSASRQPGRGKGKALNGNAAAFVPAQSSPSSSYAEASQPQPNGDSGQGSYAKPAASYRNAAMGLKSQPGKGQGQPGPSPGHHSMGSTESGTPPVSPSAHALSNGHRGSVAKPQTPQQSQVRSLRPAILLCLLHTHTSGQVLPDHTAVCGSVAAGSLYCAIYHTSTN